MNNKKNGIPKLRFPGFTGAWEQRKLGEVAKKITKGTTPHDKSWSGPVNYVKTESIDSNNGNISVIANTSLEEHEGYLKRSQLKENDVLFSIVGTLGRVGVVKKKDLPANTNQQICIIRPFEENSFFLLNALKTNRVKSFIKSDATIGAQPSLSLWQIEGLRIPFPNLEEQQKISAFFVKLDSLIALHQRKLEHLQEQKKGLLQKMFPKNGEVVPEVRFPGFTDAWEQRKLGEVGKTQSGVGFPNKEQGGHQGIPFFKVSDMNNEGNEFEMKISNNYVTEIQITNRKWKPISGVPAVIFAKVGAALMLNRKRLVKVPFLIDNNAMAYIFNKKWDPYFGKILFDTLNLPRYAQIGALPSFNGSDIEKIKVMLPSLEEQQTLSQFFQNINSLIALHQRKLEHLELMKKGLLQQMFV